MWDLSFNRLDNFYDEVTDLPTNKLTVYTMAFNTFIFMHIFNEINCRKVGPAQFNVFQSIFKNWIFIGIVVGTIGL